MPNSYNLGKALVTFGFNANVAAMVHIVAERGWAHKASIPQPLVSMCLKGRYVLYRISFTNTLSWSGRVKQMSRSLYLEPNPLAEDPNISSLASVNRY